MNLIQEIQIDEWWQDVMPPMLENVPRRLRALVKLIEKQQRKPIYTDLEDEIGDETAIELPGFTSTGGGDSAGHEGTGGDAEVKAEGRGVKDEWPTVRFINDDQIKMADTEPPLSILRLINQSHHRRVGRNEHVALGVLFGNKVHRRSLRQMLLERVHCLIHQCHAVGQEQHALARVIKPSAAGCALVKLIEKQQRKPIYTDFADELGGETTVELPGFATPDSFERFRAKTRQFLREHEDDLVIHKLRMNEPLTAADLQELERMLSTSGWAHPEHLQKAKAESNGLGLFVRSWVGLDREAAKMALRASCPEELCPRTKSNS